MVTVVCSVTNLHHMASLLSASSCNCTSYADIVSLIYSKQIMGRGYGGSILVHVGTNNTDNEGTTAIVEKYMNLLKKTKQARDGQIIYREFYQCLETGYKDTEIRRGWQSTGW